MYSMYPRRFKCCHGSQTISRFMFSSFPKTEFLNIIIFSFICSFYSSEWKSSDCCSLSYTLRVRERYKLTFLHSTVKRNSSKDKNLQMLVTYISNDNRSVGSTVCYLKCNFTSIFFHFLLVAFTIVFFAYLKRIIVLLYLHFNVFYRCSLQPVIYVVV